MRVAVPALAAALLAGCSSDDSRDSAPTPSPSPTQTADPAYHQPAVGVCRSMTPAAIDRRSNDGPTVDCAGAHEARTVAAWQSATDLARVRNRAVLPPAVYREIRSRCAPVLAETVGVSEDELALTWFGFSFFLPTREEIEHGANWIRCDINLYGPHGRLLGLPATTPYAGPDGPDGADGPDGSDGADDADDLPASQLLCLTAAPEYRPVPCSTEHAYRGAEVIRLRTQGRPFPGPRAVDRIARERCRDVLGGSDLAWLWPDAPSWRRDHAVIRCFEPVT